MRWTLSGVVFVIFFSSINASSADDERLQRAPAQILVENLQGALAAAGTEQVRNISPIGMELLKAFETWQPKVYNDIANYCTIGFGHILALQPCEAIDTRKFAAGITLEEGGALLEADTIYARLAVEQLTSRYLNDDQYSAVVTFVFSVGSERFRNSRMLSLINEGKLVEAAREFDNWIRLGGKVMPSLVARRSCEKKLYGSELALEPSLESLRDGC